jgi:hypothetical protein
LQQFKLAAVSDAASQQISNRHTSSCFPAEAESCDGSGVGSRLSLLERVTRLSKGRGTPSLDMLPMEFRCRERVGAAAKGREAGWASEGWVGRMGVEEDIGKNRLKRSRRACSWVDVGD